jgi:hypothetical protein
MTDHVKDSDCTVDQATNLCTGCGVEHGEPCPACGRRAFHRDGCPVLGEYDDEPEIDDTVHECPNCERPQQFAGLCSSCMTEMRETPNDPFWSKLADAGKL